MTTIGGLATAVSASPEASLVVKLTLAAAIGLAGAYLSRRAAAAVRHVVLSSTIVVLLGLPVATAILPALDVAVTTPPVTTARSASAVATPTTPRANPSLPDDSGERARGMVLPAGRTLVRAIWIGGTALVALSLAPALWRVRRLRQRGLPWLEARDLVAPLGDRAGIRRRVDLLVHEEIPAPLTCGVFKPVIILPADARDWPEAELRRALVHELAHVQRGDWAVHVLSRLACAAYWFHPFVWIICRQLALDAERAADDAVLEREESTQYADQLVALARRMVARSAEPAIGMAHRSDLSARVTSVLDRRQARGRAGMLRAATVAAMAAALVVALAPLRAVATVAASPAVNASESTGQRRSAAMRLDRALVEAVDSGDMEDVVALVDEGANVNAMIDGDGSPLIVAAREGQLAIATLLLDRGADPNLAVEGDGNPLIMAAREGHTAIVDLLLNRGARVDDVVPADENALIQASGEGHLDVVKLLVARGADVNARVWAERAFERPQGEWRTPLNMARRAGRRDVVAFLLSVGAVE